MFHPSPRAYVNAVHGRIVGQLERLPLHPEHDRLLRASLAGPTAQAVAEPLGNPLSALYLVARAHGCAFDELAERVGAFCLLHILSLDLFDDVQDDDLADTAHAEVGEPLAINSAITLSFMAGDQLRRALELEGDPAQRMRYLELYSRVGLDAVAGQHRDLMGAAGAQSPEEVLGMQQAKTSSVLLVIECGALLGGCDQALQARYRRLGGQLARLIQVRDDLQDIFGRSRSPDLITGKNSYPVACFLAAADAQARGQFERLTRELPSSQPQLRSLLYDSGAVQQAAQMLQQCREAIHHEVVAIDVTSAPLRALLEIVDALAASVFAPPPIPQSEPMWRPAGPWHDQVRAEVLRFVERMSPLGLPAPPELRPWHQPHWLYQPACRTIYYPDIQGLAAELLPYHAALLGCDDLAEVSAMLHGQIPLLVAHEMFHFWRDAADRLGDDHWHEEWAANRLALAYCRRFAPQALHRTGVLAARIVARHWQLLDEQVEALLARCDRPAAGASGYGMGMSRMAVASMEMLLRLQRQPDELTATVVQLIGPRAGLDVTVVAEPLAPLPLSA